MNNVQTKIICSFSLQFENIMDNNLFNLNLFILKIGIGSVYFYLMVIFTWIVEFDKTQC